MRNNLWWKFALIIGVMAVFAVAIIPTSKRPEPIPFGLDLKGGTHLVMQVNTIDAINGEVDQAMEAIKAQSVKASLPLPTVKRSERGSFSLVPPAGIPVNSYEKVGHDWLGQFEQNAGANELTFKLQDAAARQIEDQTVLQAIETIRNRVDALGVTEPVIARQGGIGGDRIVIQLPGVDDPVRVKEIIRTTAQLQFRIVEATGQDDKSILASLPSGVTANDVDILPGDRQDEFGRTVGREYYAVRKSVPVTGQDLKTARVQKGELGASTIAFTLTPEGGRKFADLTSSNVNRQLAIVLDNKVQSAPSIHERIEDQGVISGRFTPQEAADLALILRSGSLPASLTTLEERTVGPSLGRDSIREGVTASLLGFSLLVILLLLYYKGAGINAIVALILNLIILLGLLAYFHATLTLPGIVGIILTLGMAVDSNVLVFERIREERRAGKSVRASIETGFQLAFGTIIDTHLTTMLSALFLFQFGTGPVKGFAVTLLMGLGASVFTAFFVSRVIFDLIYMNPNRPATQMSI